MTLHPDDIIPMPELLRIRGRAIRDVEMRVMELEEKIESLKNAAWERSERE